VGANKTGYAYWRVPVGAFSVSLDNLWPAASLKARRPNFFRCLHAGHGDDEARKRSKLPGMVSSVREIRSAVSA
jgi:hypothetical protein